MEFLLEIHIKKKKEKAHERIKHFKIQLCASTLSTFKLLPKKERKRRGEKNA